MSIVQDNQLHKTLEQHACVSPPDRCDHASSNQKFALVCAAYTFIKYSTYLNQHSPTISLSSCRTDVSGELHVYTKKCERLFFLTSFRLKTYYKEVGYNQQGNNCRRHLQIRSRLDRYISSCMVHCTVNIPLFCNMRTLCIHILQILLL